MPAEADTALLSLLVRMGATAGFVFAMSWLVAHASERLAAFAISLPVVIGPGFFVLTMERETAFVAVAAESALGALAGTVVFAVGVALLARRVGSRATILGALGLWLVAASLAGLANGWAANALTFTAVYALGLRALPPPADVSRAGRGWSRARSATLAVAAGGLVAVVTLAAGVLGPTVSATLIALPVGLLFVALDTLRTANSDTVARVMAAGARGTASLALFLVLVRSLLPVGISAVAAIVLATLGGMILSAWLTRWTRASPGRSGT